MENIAASSSLDHAAETPGRHNLQSFNSSAFHRWYSFVLGYSDQVVDHVLDRFGAKSGNTVLDPFCGTATTLIQCAKRDIASIGIDANPFAVFAGEVKCQFDCDPTELAQAASRVEARYKALVSSNRRFTDSPTYAYLAESGMIDRGWISKKPLRKALALREAIQRGRNADLSRMLMLALIADVPTNIGNMKFGPQIYIGPSKNDVDPIPLFKARVKAMVEDLKGAESYRVPKIVLGDARDISTSLKSSKKNSCEIDFVICSPPYPTEHDYTRHTRLELAFTDNVSCRASLRGIKRTMIRSHTKGIYKGDSDAQDSEGLGGTESLAAKVEEAILGKQSGFEKLYPTVVRSYFGGMRRHFASLFPLMKSGARAAYVVGDQASYIRIPIRTAELLGEAAESVGFEVDGIELWRRRWATGISEYLDENILFLTKP